MENRRVVLTERPEGIVDASNFEVETVSLGPLAEGDVRVQVSHVSVDAFIRTCLLYTSPSPRDQRGSRMPSSA